MAWFYAMLLFSNSTCGMRSNFIRRQLGIGMRSAYRLCDKIRTHAAFYDRPQMLGGPGKDVYVDEVHINRILNRDLVKRDSATVLGIRSENEILSGIIRDRTRDTLVSAIEARVKPGSIIITDAHASYKSLSRRGWRHVVVNHARAFHNFHGVTTNPIETYWSNIRRHLRANRQVAAENLWKFLAEVEFRFNCRYPRNSSHFDILISAFPAVTESSLKQIEKRYDWR
jgi:transposase-like protein